jgi:hypothetical protein
MRDYPSVVVSDDDAVSIGHGKRIEVPRGTVAVVNGAGRLLAVFEDGTSAVVLAAGG